MRTVAQPTIEGTIPAPEAASDESARESGVHRTARPMANDQATPGAVVPLITPEFLADGADQLLATALHKTRLASSLIGENVNPQSLEEVDEKDLERALVLLAECRSLIRAARSNVRRVSAPLRRARQLGADRRAHEQR